jgi:tetratricopeptide (TPR) repeat protein
MLSRSTPLLAPLVWLFAMLVLACRPGSGPVTPLAPPPPPTAAPSLPTPPPISLTASDGSGLALASLRAHAVVEDPLALTELELAFINPRNEIIEGRFELLLPPGARVTRFAIHPLDGDWQEAEVVEKQAARQAYETFLHEDRDPALLERDTGNRFSARVFPIEPYGRKRILISYVETLADPTEPYRLAVRGLPSLEELDLRVVVVNPVDGTHRVEQHHAAHEAPAADLVVHRNAPHDHGVRHGEQVMARVQPLAGFELGDTAPLRRLTVLVDTSASRALDFDASLASLGRVLQALARLAGTAQLQVLAFDQEVVPIYSGPLVGFGAASLAALHARRPLGASDLGAALQALQGGEHQRVLLVSDGLVSAGEHSDAALRRQLKALAATGLERLDALVLGSVRDEPRLQRLVAGPLPRSGVLLRAGSTPEHLAERLVQPTVDGLRVEVPGARWWSPTRLDGVQPGDHVMVYADLPEHQPLHVQVSGPAHRDVEVTLRPSTSPLHVHGWRQAQIQGLVERLAALQDALESERLRRHVVELSVRHRIFNDHTAFLVLESDEDYARFGLDRRALADILVVGASGVEVEQRTVVEAPPTTNVDDAPPTALGHGVISGVVNDSRTKEKLSSALVLLQCECLLGAREMMTNENGRYAFRELPPGTYTVQVLSGQANVSKVLTLPRDDKFRANFSIDPQNEFRRVVRVKSSPVGRRNEHARRETEEFRVVQKRGRLHRRAEKPESEPPPISDAPPPPPPPMSPPASRWPSDAEPAVVPKTDPSSGEYWQDELKSMPDPAKPEPEETEIVTSSTVSGHTLTMEELRNVPVGSSTSRDFTAAIESAPGVAVDASGIRLAGTTGAESRYIVEGSSNMRLPSAPVDARVSLQKTVFDGSHTSPRLVRRWLRFQLDPVRLCYFRALADDPKLRGRLVIRLELDAGKVSAVGKREQRGLDHPDFLRCLERALLAWEVPWQGDELTQTLVFHPNDGPPVDYWHEDEDPFAPEPASDPATAHSGPFAEVQAALTRGDRTRALAQATAWRERAPVDVLALVALGDAARARGDLRRAARAYGSIIDLYPSRAEMLRFAAANLETLADPAALDVAIDAYRQAVAQRPDHATGHRNLAFALLHRGEPQAAFEALDRALRQPYPPDRFAGAQRVLQEDLGIVAAAWLRLEPTRGSTIHERLAALGVPLATTPSLRVVLTWETDANDVDLHVRDNVGHDAFAQHPLLDSGGELVADVNNGFGPECVTIPGPPPAYPYDLQVHYYARGPMGYGLGKVQVLHHDGEGGVQLDDRPFVAMEDDAWLHLGKVTPPAVDPALPAPGMLH